MPIDLALSVLTLGDVLLLVSLLIGIFLGMAEFTRRFLRVIPHGSRSGRLEIWFIVVIVRIFRTL
jgi:Na+-transporting methylmalonyl-CoA/oxaloacetate decarboxylase gamma subunit